MIDLTQERDVETLRQISLLLERENQRLITKTLQLTAELPPDQRVCPACGGELTDMTGQTEDSERITTVKLTYQLEHHVRQKYRCACNGAVVTAPGPAQVIPGGRYAPEFGIGVAVANYADHLPLERQ